MKRILFYNLLFFIAFIMGCQKKDLPDPVDGTPVFSAELDFGNGNTKSWEAGVDSFYMYTSFDKNQFDVMHFSGKMERENCTPPCRETLEIIIRDFGQTAAPQTNVDEALSLVNYQFAMENPMDTSYIINTIYTYQVNLSVDTSVVPVNSDTQYEWSENGNQFLLTSELNATRTYDQVPNAEIRLEVTDTSNSCVVWQTQQIKIPKEDRCAVRINPLYNVDHFLEALEAIPFTQAVTYTFDWSNGITGNILDGQIEPLLPYSVVLTDANDCQSDAGFVWSGLIGGDTSIACSAHFNYEVLQIPSFTDTIITIIPGDPLQLSKVTIIYVDELGNTFRSDRFGQSSNAFFSIENVEEYDENENGFPTKKLGLHFSCLLWDENNNVLPIVDGKAVWGVAYPE